MLVEVTKRYFLYVLYLGTVPDARRPISSIPKHTLSLLLPDISHIFDATAAWNAYTAIGGWFLPLSPGPLLPALGIPRRPCKCHDLSIPRGFPLPSHLNGYGEEVRVSNLPAGTTLTHIQVRHVPSRSSCPTAFPAAMLPGGNNRWPPLHHFLQPVGDEIEDGGHAGRGHTAPPGTRRGAEEEATAAGWDRGRPLDAVTFQGACIRNRWQRASLRLEKQSACPKRGCQPHGVHPADC